MAELGNSIPLTCPACAAPIALPLTQVGADLMSVTLAIDLAALRHHIATQHPQEHPMSAITDRFHQVVTELEAEGHHLADEARAVFAHYEKEAAAVLDGVKPILADLRTGIAADVTDAVARVEAAVAKVEALVNQPPAGS
ncbi:hypothetical protein [Streptomyces mirabilis]|uniref:hypothetical protein n=1 Tax=Streptomyces mirabilis TaxID=68239 RepID=UPI0033E4FEC3